MRIETNAPRHVRMRREHAHMVPTRVERERTKAHRIDRAYRCHDAHGRRMARTNAQSVDHRSIVLPVRKLSSAAATMRMEASTWSRIRRREITPHKSRHSNGE